METDPNGVIGARSRRLVAVKCRIELERVSVPHLLLVEILVRGGAG